MKKPGMQKPLLKTVSAVFVVGALLGLTACDDDVRVRSVSVGSSIYQPYDYYYYPTARVYFNISTGDYFYPDRDRWVRGRSLPSHYRVNDNDRVSIRIKSKDQPYMYQNEHRAKYAPRSNNRRDKRRY